eukprot:XP_025009175.1 protein FAM107B isoform X3 [Gallus gallus]
MHPFPCSALLTCFGNAHENTPFDQPNTSPLAMEEQKTEETRAVCQQPAARAASSLRQAEERGIEGMFKAMWYSEKHGRTNSSSGNHTAIQPLSATTEPSVFAAKELNHEAIALCTHIPRPSIIHVPKEEEEEEKESQKELDLPVLENEPSPGAFSPKRRVPAFLISSCKAADPSACASPAPPGPLLIWIHESFQSLSRWNRAAFLSPAEPFNSYGKVTLCELQL